jgi:hypothetical protein
MTPCIDPATLRPGDVLLMKGIGAVSDLIAWFGDSTYSHAAVVVDGGALVEAAAPVSRRVAIADRLTQGRYYDFIDAYRPTRGDGRPLEAADRAAIAASAMNLLSVPYPLDALAQMALFAAIRNRIPADPTIRFILRELTELLTRDDPSQMVCSELVYRALADARVIPAGNARPTLVVSAPLDLPFPKIDLAELIREWEEARRRRPTLAALPASLADGAVTTPLDDAFEALRAQVEIQDGGFVIRPIPDPNPRNVLPVDLETSPQLRRLGRLPLSAS